MKPHNPMMEDSFEKARKAFFGTPVAACNENALPAERTAPETNHREGTILPPHREEATTGNATV